MATKARYLLLVAVSACSPSLSLDPCANSSCPPGSRCDATTGVCEVEAADAGAVDSSCAGATPLTAAPLLANTTTGTSTYTTECGGEGNDLLFRFTLTEARDVMLVGSPIDRGMPILALLQPPCAPGALTTLACGDGTVLAYDLPPGDYYALLDSPLGAGGPTELNLILTAPTPPPSNDTCAQAQPLVFVNDRASASGDTRPATQSNLPDAGTPSCSPSARSSGRDVVYRYTLAEPRSVTVTLRPSGAWRPALYVTATCAGPELGCSAPAAAGPVTLSFPDQPAGTYFVWVDGTASGGGHATAGQFTLEVTR